MKWLFLLGLLVMTPALAVYLRANPRYVPWTGFAIGILPFLLSGLNLAASPISWAHWPGPVKGLDISLLDAIAIAIVFATKPVKTPVAMKVAFAIYAFAVLLSTALSETKEASIFYVFQLARAVLVYWAVARATANFSNFPMWLINGLIAGIVLQAFVATRQFIGGDPQAGGWFGHQNLLGICSHFGVYPALALFLAGVAPKRTMLAVAAGLLIAFTGGSRATIGLFAIGSAITITLSMWHSMSGRKGAIAGGMLLVLLLSAPLLISAVQRRSSDRLAASNLERSNMIAAARMIISDYPLGVGPNRYVVVANVGGYSDRAGVAWNKANREAPVHNSYYLVTGEMGWIGLVGMVSLLASIVAVGLSGLSRHERGLQGDLLVGATATMLVFIIHSYFEWVTMYFHVHYLLAINVGLLVGVRAVMKEGEQQRLALKRARIREQSAGKVLAA